MHAMRVQPEYYASTRYYVGPYWHSINHRGGFASCLERGSPHLGRISVRSNLRRREVALDNTK